MARIRLFPWPRRWAKGGHAGEAARAVAAEAEVDRGLAAISLDLGRPGTMIRADPRHAPIFSIPSTDELRRMHEQVRAEWERQSQQIAGLTMHVVGRPPADPIRAELERVRSRIGEHERNLTRTLNVLHKRRVQLNRLIDGQINPRDILEERNQEVRRVLLERYGFQRFMEDAGAQVIAKDEFGELLAIPMTSPRDLGDPFLSVAQMLQPRVFVSDALARGLLTASEMREREVQDRRRRADPNVYKAVRVLNSTPEPDGTRKTYVLRVPHWVETPREGLAWTFGFDDPQDYCPALET